MGIVFMVFMVVGGVVAMWAVQRDNKIGQGLKQIETEERDGPVLRGLFGGGTGETGGGRKGIWVWRRYWRDWWWEERNLGLE